MGILVKLNNFDISERLIFVKNTIHYGAPNYKEMVDELKKHDEMTHEKIAFVLPIVGASTVSDWARGYTVSTGAKGYSNASDTKKAQAANTKKQSAILDAQYAKKTGGWK